MAVLVPLVVVVLVVDSRDVDAIFSSFFSSPLGPEWLRAKEILFLHVLL